LERERSKKIRPPSCSESSLEDTTLSNPSLPNTPTITRDHRLPWIKGRKERERIKGIKDSAGAYLLHYR